MLLTLSPYIVAECIKRPLSGGGEAEQHHTAAQPYTDGKGNGDTGRVKFTRVQNLSDI